MGTYVQRHAIQTFEFREMISILGMSPSRAKNWTVGRPFKLEPSIRTASGQGSRNLYSLEDVYLMGVANELSAAGMAAATIGELVAALKEKFPDGLAAVGTLYVARGANLTYRIETREDRLPTSSIVRLAIKTGKLREQIDQRTRRRSH
jgi:DNA-binding transcriptional MerR regulator